MTICTKDRQHLFWNVGAITNRLPNKPQLSHIGLIAEKLVKQISLIYPNILIEKFTIMPNHVHILIQIFNTDDTQCGRLIDAPTISRIIQQYKRAVTKEAGIPVWQKSFYEHIVRNDQEYQQIWRYIDENPLKWLQDCYYC